MYPLLEYNRSWRKRRSFRSVATIPAKQYTVLFFRLSANTQTSLLAPYSNPALTAHKNNNPHGICRFARRPAKMPHRAFYSAYFLISFYTFYSGKIATAICSPIKSRLVAFYPNNKRMPFGILLLLAEKAGFEPAPRY